MKQRYHMLNSTATMKWTLQQSHPYEENKNLPAAKKITAAITVSHSNGSIAPYQLNQQKKQDIIPTYNSMILFWPENSCN